MRSISVRTSSGWTPQAGDRNSHSLGPRLPCSASRASRPVRNSVAGPSSPVRRSGSPSSPASKAAVSSAESATRRLRSHMAKLGAADATPPRPPAIRRSSPGLPRPRAMAVMAPIVTEAAALTSPCVANTRANTGIISRMRATNPASDAVPRSGRAATSASTSATCSSSRGNSVAVIQENMRPSTLATISGSSSLGRGT